MTLMLRTGRLEDKSSIVRKAALQLLTALLLYNPFGGELPEGRFEASLTEWKAKLQVIVVLLPIARLTRVYRIQGKSPVQWTGKREPYLKSQSHGYAVPSLIPINVS